MPVHAEHEAQGSKLVARHHHFRESHRELLTDEHRVIERVLAVLEKLTTKPVENSLDCWRKALDFFSYFVDQCHHFKEERVLFPAMEERGIPREEGPIGTNANGARGRKGLRENDDGGAESCGSKKRGGQGYPSQQRQSLSPPFAGAYTKGR